MLFKIDNVILTTKSRVNHIQISIQNKYQMMMLLLAGVKFIKTKYSYQRCLKPSFIIFGSRKQKLFCSNYSTKMRENEKVGKNVLDYKTRQ